MTPTPAVQLPEHAAARGGGSPLADALRALHANGGLRLPSASALARGFLVLFERARPGEQPAAPGQVKFDGAANVYEADGMAVVA